MKCYKAKWILTSFEVLEDMAIVVDEGKIIDIIPNSQVNFEEKYVKDLGNAVITPGFIDLLTQYQYTDILEARPQNFKSKIKRFFKMLNLKYTFAGVLHDNYSRKWAGILTNYFTLDRNNKINSFKHGVTESIKAGTTCIAQVSKEFKYFDIINKLPIKNYLFFEVFADSKDNSKKTFKELRGKVEDLIWHKGENTHIGIMLNSISGVHRKLWALFSKYCRKHNMLMMTRFAESKDEMEWLEYGFSDIDLLHKFMGMRKITPYANDITPVEYLDNLKVLTKKVLVANANYDTSELDKLALTGAKYIYQPLYSEEICNSVVDFKTVLEHFHENFGLSTQSFAQDRSFSLLKLANELNKDGLLDIVELVKYLTLYPAKILRLDNSIGSIEVGKDADFNVFKLPEGEDYKALSTLEFPYSTYSKGRKLVKRGEIRFSL
jgi:cytosine/adenosine deaminase-related metal-dependent hydrolase